MDKRIDKEVLEYMDIHKTKEATSKKIELGLKVKDDIAKLTNFNIEKVYIMDQYAWGESDNRPAFCFLTDVRVRDINEKYRLVEDYAYKNNINMLVWSMCQFEKRKNNPTELDYYIENYGVKIYDSGKLVDINENVKATAYASKMEFHRYYYQYRKNNPEALMKDLLEIYALKIDYPVNDNKKLEQTIEYIKHISKDKFVLDAIKEFNKKDSNKLEICKKLEKYIKELKQIRPKMELDNIPTMKVYERLLDIKNREGKVNISNLTKENMYTMEVVQDKFKDDIETLFDINEKEFDKIRRRFGFKIIDSIWYNNIGELIAKTVDKDPDYSYKILKVMGVFNFQKHTYDILKYMRDGEKYLLKEFWKLTNGKRSGIELKKATTAKDVYFRAYFCAELLKQNDLVEEVDYLEYKITKKGKKLLEKLEHKDVEELDLIEICNIFGQASFYALFIIKMNNGELLFCADSEEIDKYCGETEEIDLEEEETTLQEIELTQDEKKIIEEVAFGEILIKNNLKAKQKSQEKRTKADYQKINVSKEKVGKDSEKMIYDLEKDRLIKEGRPDLAESVIWESEENGDGAGYDIRSFEKRGKEYIEIFIEVKGTNKSINEPFDISKNEVDASNKYKNQYYIYRVGNIYSSIPKFYKINGKIEDNFTLEAISFKARKK